MRTIWFRNRLLMLKNGKVCPFINRFSTFHFQSTDQQASRPLSNMDSGNTVIVMPSCPWQSLIVSSLSARRTASRQQAPSPLSEFQKCTLPRRCTQSWTQHRPGCRSCRWTGQEPKYQRYPLGVSMSPVFPPVSPREAAWLLDSSQIVAFMYSLVPETCK
jgi:hypothetical protein